MKRLSILEILLFVLNIGRIGSFVLRPPSCISNTILSATKLSPVAPDKVHILPDADAVSNRIVSIVNEAASKAISSKGHFNLAIPGGSILNMLSEISDPPWASKTTLAYVNHKCVENDDLNLSTHAKANSKFLSTWSGCNVLTLTGSSSPSNEAEIYKTSLKSLPLKGSYPSFDLCLIGVGTDGHIGSLYPSRPELTLTDWILPVSMKEPGSITFSLPMILNSEEIVIAACGVSEKYPLGKSEGMKRAIMGDETVETFPAVGLREKATWIIDEAAGSSLEGY
ncbi:hypothetical protein TrST_g9381 [Triparma strigata]|uniref:Glucosamine/galactosamine-6-phosphate isomerase domain-containing protein n=1 Tax=Triparma strigata TaxID=1606541 RepID=A0A9W7BU61_9STRA|nr:hypothetical protein TrST_g9381 [Triparma strigata]